MQRLVPLLVPASVRIDLAFHPVRQLIGLCGPAFHPFEAVAQLFHCEKLAVRYALLPTTAAVRIQDLQRFSGQADHAVASKDLRALIVVRDKIAEDHRPRSPGKLEDCHRAVLDAGGALVLVGLALDVAHHPNALVVGQQVTVHVSLV